MNERTDVEMSDAQTIFLILLAFYFFECLKWAPLGACAFTQQWWPKREWVRYLPFIQFYGGKKSVFLAPLIPYSRVQWITDAVGEAAYRDCPSVEINTVRKQVHALVEDSKSLRIASAGVFLIYFVYLPVVHQSIGEGSYLYSGVGLGYLGQIYVAVRYYMLHRQYYPEVSGRRWLHTLYSAVLPWHAMRASDEFFGTYYQKWSELTLLAAFVDQADARAWLSFYWREAVLAKTSHYRADTLRPLMEEVGLSEDEAMVIVKPTAGVKYCPCCATQYEARVEQCVDCADVELLSA